MDNFIWIEEKAAPGHLSSRWHYIPTESISHITKDTSSDDTWVCLKTGEQIPVYDSPVTIITNALRASILNPDGTLVATEETQEIK